MSSWNEDNFLEETIPLLRQGRGHDSSGDHRCPDPDTLCAVLDGEASERLKEAVAGHAERCPACARLQQRLVAFERASGCEADWSQTEKRLDNWLEGRLAAPPAGREQRADGGTWWRNFTSPDRWKLQWVVAAAVVLMVAAGVFMIERGRPVRPAEVAAIPQIPIPPASVQSPPDAKASGDFEKSLTGKMVETVKSAQGPARGSTRTPAPVAEPPSVQTATAEPPPASHPANPLPAGIFRPVNMTAAAQVRGPVSAPPRVRLYAGTRVWILLKALHQRPDNSFTFRGVVLLPVTQGHAVLLNQETEVYGVGSVSQGRTSVRIQQFGLNGALYLLTSQAGATDDQAPGSGGSLQFDTGQVLEMWLASASTYQRVSGETGQP